MGHSGSQWVAAGHCEFICGSLRVTWVTVGQSGPLWVTMGSLWVSEGRSGSR